MSKIKLLIADDHPLFLDGIVSLLKTEKEFIVTATASNGQEALELSGNTTFDVCILDINMPILNGIETARKMKERGYSGKIIILTTYNDKEFISEMLLIGVSGYVLKSATKAELINAIKDVLMGKTYFSAEVHDSIFDNYLQGIKKEKHEVAENPVTLTPREIEIVDLLTKEYTNENIASTLNISFRTVETHRKNIMQKTKAKNLAGLIKYAYSKGILK